LEGHDEAERTVRQSEQLGSPVEGVFVGSVLVFGLERAQPDVAVIRSDAIENVVDAQRECERAVAHANAHVSVPKARAVQPVARPDVVRVE
jgi:hypothetical protein